MELTIERMDLLWNLIDIYQKYGADLKMVGQCTQCEGPRQYCKFQVVLVDLYYGTVVDFFKIWGNELSPPWSLGGD